MHAGTSEQQQRQQQLERLLASAAKMLPTPQLGLATAPSHTPGPALSLDKASALGQVAMPSHLSYCVCLHRLLEVLAWVVYQLLCAYMDRANAITCHTAEVEHCFSKHLICTFKYPSNNLHCCTAREAQKALLQAVNPDPAFAAGRTQHLGRHPESAAGL